MRVIKLNNMLINKWSWLVWLKLMVTIHPHKTKNHSLYIDRYLEREIKESFQI